MADPVGGYAIEDAPQQDAGYAVEDSPAPKAQALPTAQEILAQQGIGPVSSGSPMPKAPAMEDRGSDFAAVGGRPSYLPPPVTASTPEEQMAQGGKAYAEMGPGQVAKGVKDYVRANVNNNDLSLEERNKLTTQAGTEFVTGAGNTILPLTGAGLATAPLRTVGGIGASVLASEGAEKGAEKLGASPDTQKFAGAVGGFAPLAVALGGIRGEAGPIGEEGKGAFVSGMNDRVAAGVAKTPEGFTVAGRMGGKTFSKTFGGKGKSPATEGPTIDAETMQKASEAEATVNAFLPSLQGTDLAKAAVVKAVTPEPPAAPEVTTEKPNITNIAAAKEASKPKVKSAPAKTTDKISAPAPKVVATETKPAESATITPAPETAPPAQTEQKLNKSTNSDISASSAPPAAEQPRYKFVNTQADIPADSEASQSLEKLRSEIPAEHLMGDGADIGGNHITVRYGIKGNDTSAIRAYLEQQAPFEASLGKTDKFEPSEHSDGAAPIIAPIDAPELHRINAEIEKHGEFAPSSFPEYKPHATIAYVKPEVADKYTGRADTEGKKFLVKSISITDRNGNSTPVELKGEPSGYSVEEPSGQSIAEGFSRRSSLLERIGRSEPQPTGVEQRSDLEQRKRVSQMSREEMRRALLTSDFDIPNGRAFEEAEQVQSSPFLAMSDADGLKAVNDNFGHSAGSALLQAKADAIKEAGLEAYHVSGDEFAYRGASREELASKLDKAREILRKAEFEGTAADGQKVILRGADFSYGIGQSVEEADRGLNAHKQQRLAIGERAPRGELGRISSVGQGTRRPDGTEAGEVTPPRIRPGARSAFTGNETGRSSLQDLTSSVKRNTSPIDERVKEIREAPQREARRTVEEAKSLVAALWDAYKHPRPSILLPREGDDVSDYLKAVGDWTTADQSSAINIDNYTKATEKAIPSKTKREAATPLIQSQFDEAKLRQQLEQLKKTSDHTRKYVAQWEAALKMTDAEKTIAQNTALRNEASGQEMVDEGLIRQMKENYMHQAWEDGPARKQAIEEPTFRSLSTKPGITKKSTIPTYFDGIMAGMKPKTLDSVALTAVHERALREALAARSFIKSLLGGKATDGRPLAVTSEASMRELPTESGKDQAYLIKPSATTEQETGDYRVIDHPALRGYKWASTINGKSLIVEGDIRIHPEIYRHLKNTLTRSALRNYSIKVGDKTIKPGELALNGSAAMKQVVLSIIPARFHRTAEELRALKYGVNPWHDLPELDPSDPRQALAMRGGLKVAEYRGQETFMDGLGQSPELFKHVPWYGDFVQRHSDQLFRVWLPQLKMKTWMTLYDRNRANPVFAKMTDLKVSQITAKQVNAGYGLLNYKYMGRNSTMQDFLRLLAIAPDFAESEAKTVGQALRPEGWQQLRHLLVGAAATYVIARALNMMINHDPKWKEPFGVVVNGKAYGFRGTEIDFYNAVAPLFMDHKTPVGTNIVKPLLNRESPLAKIVTGGGQSERAPKHESAGDWAKRTAMHNAPIPLQPWLQKSNDSNAQKAAETALKMLGVDIKKEKK